MRKTKTKSRKAWLDRYERTVVWSEEDAAWIVSFPELKGCKTHGETVEEAMKNAQEALELYIESCEAEGIEIPVPAALIKASGKFVVRIAPELHARLIRRAKEEDESLNGLVTGILQQHISG